MPLKPSHWKIHSACSHKAEPHSGLSALVQLCICVAKLRTSSLDVKIASDRGLQTGQGMSVFLPHTHPTGIRHILYRLMYQPHSLSVCKNLPPKSGTAVPVSLKTTANPFLTSSQGYNHRQGYPVSKYIKPSETAIAAAASAPLHFYNTLKKHEYEPQQQWRGI